MTDLDRRSTGLAISLSLLAGFVDAIGFLVTGGFFVSFMTGNSTRVGVGIGELDFRVAGLGLGVIACFVAGVAIGTVIASLSRRRQRSRVLFLVALFLAVGAFAWVFRVPHMGLIFIVMAMGAENAVFHRDGEPSIGLTYMTGVLVKMGQIIAGLFTGTPRWEWLKFLGLWVGLIIGAAIGCWGYGLWGTNALALGIGWALILALVARQPGFDETANSA